MNELNRIDSNNNVYRTAFRLNQQVSKFISKWLHQSFLLLPELPQLFIFWNIFFVFWLSKFDIVYSLLYSVNEFDCLNVAKWSKDITITNMPINSVLFIAKINKIRYCWRYIQFSRLITMKCIQYVRCHIISSLNFFTFWLSLAVWVALLGDKFEITWI